MPAAELVPPPRAFGRPLSQAQSQPRLARYAALAIIFTVLASAAFPGWLAPQDPYAIDPSNAFLWPGAGHWFGTDQNGRDTLSRVIFGSRASLLVGVEAIAIALGLGALLGIGAAMGGPWADRLIKRLIDVLFAFPGIILALVLIAVLGASAQTLAIAVGTGSAAGYAKIIRTQTLDVAHAEYLQAVRALGTPPWRVLLHTQLPNIARPLLPLFTLGVGQCIVWATGLSFLGLGVQPPSSEWGAMLADSRNYTAMAWWLTLFPGATIALTSLALSVLGRDLQARYDAQASQ